MPFAPASFDDTRSDYIERYLEPLLPDVGAVETFHRGLVDYLARPDARHLVRAVAGLERGVPVTTLDGATLIPGDNSPAWWWHAVLFNDLLADPPVFASFIEATPFHMFKAPARKETLNAKGWYVAHILDVRNRDGRWLDWPTTTAVWRFVRNIHPCNVFYVPKGSADWIDVSADPVMLASVAAFYRERYAAIWDEFCTLAAAPKKHGDPAPDGRLEVTAGPSPIMASAARSAPAPRPAAPIRGGAVGGAAPGWAQILRPGAPTTTGSLLGLDPNAAALTARLVDGLTVERLIAIADAMFNRCRVRDMEAAAPGDPLRPAALAWSALFRRRGLQTYAPHRLDRDCEVARGRAG